MEPLKKFNVPRVDFKKRPKRKDIISSFRNINPDSFQEQDFDKLCALLKTANLNFVDSILSQIIPIIEDDRYEEQEILKTLISVIIDIGSQEIKKNFISLIIRNADVYFLDLVRVQELLKFAIYELNLIQHEESDYRIYLLGLIDSCCDNVFNIQYVDVFNLLIEILSMPHIYGIHKTVLRLFSLSLERDNEELDYDEDNGKLLKILFEAIEKMLQKITIFNNDAKIIIKSVSDILEASMVHYYRAVFGMGEYNTLSKLVIRIGVKLELQDYLNFANILIRSSYGGFSYNIQSRVTHSLEMGIIDALSTSLESSFNQYLKSSNTDLKYSDFITPYQILADLPKSITDLSFLFKIKNLLQVSKKVFSSGLDTIIIATDKIKAFEAEFSPPEKPDSYFRDYLIKSIVNFWVNIYKNPVLKSQLFYSKEFDFKFGFNFGTTLPYFCRPV